MDLQTRLASLYIELVKLPAALLGGRKRDILLATMAQKLAPCVEIPIGQKSLRFFCPGTLTEFRARTLLSKEPETIAWIDSFEHDAVFYDIGANVGCYTLYACLRGIRTLAFEPSAYNYFVLNENIRLNGFDDLVSAYCLALSDKTGLGLLNMSAPEVGGALALFGKKTSTIPMAGQSLAVTYKQGSLGYSLDDFIETYSLTRPTHIKIDVDGIEKLILQGASGTLAQQSVRSLLVEIDDDDQDSQAILSQLNEAGFRLSFKGKSEMMQASAMKSINNCIFVRE